MERQVFEGIFEVDDSNAEPDFGDEGADYGEDDGADYGEDGGADYGEDPDVGRLDREDRERLRDNRQNFHKGRKKGGKAFHESQRDLRRDLRNDNDLPLPPRKVKRMKPKQLSGHFETTSTTGASGVITIRAQRTFRIKDFTIIGLAGSEVTNVSNGDDVLLNEPGGVDISVYAPGTNFRSIFAGGEIEKGTDYTVAVTLPGPGTVTVVLAGEQEVHGCD